MHLKHLNAWMEPNGPLKPTENKPEWKYCNVLLYLWIILSIKKKIINMIQDETLINNGLGAWRVI
jgi:hypothetical protein